MDTDAADKISEPVPEHGLDNPVHEESLSSAPTANVGEASGEKGRLKIIMFEIF